MEPKLSLLEGAINDNISSLRPELVDNLVLVLADQKERITSFARENVLLLMEGKSPYSSELLDLLPLYFSAVYFANAHYLEYTICNDSDLVKLVISDIVGIATHAEDGLYRHRIKIPINRIDSVETVFTAMDAESRHAVHQGLLHEKNLFEEDLAKRVFLVIAETIDEGEAVSFIGEKSPHYDPFIDDFHLTSNENDGHNGAKYICRQLSEDPESLRKQLYWLSRLSIRNQEQAARQASLIPIILSKGSRSLYTHDIFYLEKFYSGELKKYNTGKRKGITEARLTLLETVPYIPPDKIIMNGREITRFVSQLDYVVLKLAFTPPEQLYREARCLTTA